MEVVVLDRVSRDGVHQGSDGRGCLVARADQRHPFGADHVEVADEGVGRPGGLGLRTAGGDAQVVEEEGAERADRLVLESMRYAPCQPSFLDARDALLLADNALFEGANHCAIWSVCAGRGLGASATTTGADDQVPEPGFDLPVQCAGGARLSFLARVSSWEPKTRGGGEGASGSWLATEGGLACARTFARVGSLRARAVAALDFASGPPPATARSGGRRPVRLTASC